MFVERKGPCECGSSDGRHEYADHFYCFVCNIYTSKSLTSKLQGIPANSELYTPMRGITKATMEKYNVWSEGNEQHYPYFKDGKHCADKVRTLSIKGFVSYGDMAKIGLFGQQLFPAGSSRAITITEGELDALSAFQMSGSKYPVVSIRASSTAEKDVAENFEYLNSFEHIVLCFDKDQPHVNPQTGETYYPGQEAALRVASMFPLGKVRILTLSDAKDANDYLQKDWGRKYEKEWWGAPVYTPQGIRLAKDLWEEVIKDNSLETVSYPWEGLNAYTSGLRRSELVTVTANTGVGKTSIVKEIEHHLLRTTTSGIGILHLEETNGNTLLGLMSITANKPLHLPDVRKELGTDELKRYWDETCNTDRIVIWDHFGSNDIAGVLNTIRHMRNLGCNYIILDHLSIVVSDQNGDERKQLDEIATKLKTLCMELNIAVIVVIHQNRQGQIRGTAGVEQLSNMVFKLERNLEDDEATRRNVTKVVVQKNRFNGQTGPACFLRYDGETGRLVELSDQERDNFVKGIVPETRMSLEENW